MPSRWVSIAIIAFWLATTGWYVSRDVWPRLASSTPPPYVIDLADEALHQMVPVRWLMWRNGEKVAPIRTSVEYQEADDSFEMTSSMHGELEIKVFSAPALTIVKLEDRYRVSRNGQLLGFGTDIACAIGSNYVHLQIQAVVKRGMATLTCRVESPGGVIEPKLEPFPVSRAGVLNPLHPVNRIQGLRPGMRWTLPLVDPIAAARSFAIRGLASAFGVDLGKSSSAGELEAVVVGPKSLSMLSQGKTVECLVIEYHGDDYSVRTWVRVSDGTVMRQEATTSGEEWVLERE